MGRPLLQCWPKDPVGERVGVKSKRAQPGRSRCAQSQATKESRASNGHHSAVPTKAPRLRRACFRRPRSRSRQYCAYACQAGSCSASEAINRIASEYSVSGRTNVRQRSGSMSLTKLVYRYAHHMTRPSKNRGTISQSSRMPWLFTQVRGRRILRSPNPSSCIATVLQGFTRPPSPVEYLTLSTTCCGAVWICTQVQRASIFCVMIC